MPATYASKATPFFQRLCAGMTRTVARAKNASLRIFAAVIDFRLRSHRASTPLRSNVSRQQSSGFNDLQGHRVPNSGTAFDKCRRIVLKAKIPLTKGRLPEASREVEWV